MKTKCAACGASASLDILITHDGAREALMAAFRMPAPLGKLLVQYLALFRPSQRDLSFDRVSTLLGELLPMIEAGQIERAGRTWAAPLPAWKEALEQMLLARDKLQLPMKSHGYLLEIIAGMGNRAEAIAEEKREQQRRDRTDEKTSGAQEKRAAKPSAPPPEFLEAVRGLTGRTRVPGADNRSFETKRQDAIRALEQEREGENHNDSQTD